MIRVTVATLALTAAAIASAQTAVPTQASAAKPTLAQLGLMVYPAKEQTKEQQAKDEAACYEWAESQTGLTMTSGGVDVNAAAAAGKAQASEAATGAAVVGAAKGAAGGAAIGAIAGDAGKGAAIGAVAGAMGGRRARKQAEAQGAQAGAQQATAVNQQNVDQFKKAAAVCLDGRGYSVR
jgi:hypothetical protein